MDHELLLNVSALHKKFASDYFKTQVYSRGRRRNSVSGGVRWIYKVGAIVSGKNHKLPTTTSNAFASVLLSNAHK